MSNKIVDDIEFIFEDQGRYTKEVSNYNYIVGGTLNIYYDRRAWKALENNIYTVAV